MKDQKYLIWSDIHIDFDAQEKFYLSENPGIGEDNIYQMIYDDLYNLLEDERGNLNVQLSQPILAIAHLGLWNGRKNGYKMIDSGNIRDCLYSDCDKNEWYVDRLGDFRCTAIHHDGTNHYLYRKLKDHVTDRQVENLLSAIISGKLTKPMLNRTTEQIGLEIAKIYGWELPGMNKKEKSQPQLA